MIKLIEKAKKDVILRFEDNWEGGTAMNILLVEDDQKTAELKSIRLIPLMMLQLLQHMTTADITPPPM